MKLSILIAALTAIAPALLGEAAHAEDVWTCTQPSVTDGKPIQLRYMISKTENTIHDEFNLPWSIIRNDGQELVAAMTFGDGPMGRLLVIDVKTGDMTLSIVNMHSTDAPSRFIDGTCVKD